MSKHRLHGSVAEMYRTVVDELDFAGKNAVLSFTESLLGYGTKENPVYYALLPVKTEAGSQLLFSRCARKLRALSPSYYVHQQLLDADAGVLHEDFDSILSTPFCSETAFEQAAEAPGKTPEPDLSWDGEAVRIEPEVLRSILWGIIARWRAGSGPVVVAVPPMSSEEYTDYTLGAVKAIYRCLPTALRGRMGFTTYTAVANNRNDVGLFFLPEEMVPQGIRLDRETESSRKLMEGYLQKPVQELIDRIVSDPDHRQEELDRLWEIVESDRELGSIRESDYTAYLEHSHLFHLELKEQADFETLNDFFRKIDEIPESLRIKLAKPLAQKVTPESLDEYALNRRVEDANFGHYIERISTLVQLCHSSKVLVDHAEDKIPRVFAEFLDYADKLAMDNLEECLTKLAQMSDGLCSKAVLQVCDEMWRKAADAIYQRWFDMVLDDIMERMKQTAHSKTPKGASLSTILGVKHKSIQEAFQTLEAELENWMKQLPQRLGTPDWVGLRKKKLADHSAELSRSLAQSYLNASKIGMRENVASGADRLKTHRSNLETLLNDLPTDSEALKEEALKQFDDEVTMLAEQVADEQFATAANGMKALDGDDAEGMRNQFEEILAELHQNLERLKSYSVDRTEQLGQFEKTSKADFRDHVKWLCNPRANALDSQEMRASEQKRLEDLKKFIKKHYPKDNDLSALVDQAVKKIQKSVNRSGGNKAQKNKIREAEPERNSGIKFYFPHTGIGSDQDVADTGNTNPVVQTQSGGNVAELSITDHTLQTFWEKIADQSTAAKVRIIADDITQEYEWKNLMDTLNCIRGEKYQQNDIGLTEQEMSVLLKQLARQHLTPQEWVNILKLLKHAGYEPPLVEQCVEILCEQRNTIRFDRQIREILRRDERFAPALARWQTHCGTRVGWVPEWKSFWLGVLAGALVMLVIIAVALTLHFALNRNDPPVGPSVPPETTVETAAPGEETAPLASTTEATASDGSEPEETAPSAPEETEPSEPTNPSEPDGTTAPSEPEEDEPASEQPNFSDVENLPPVDIGNN